ncbi:membrane protein [Novosphingobium marinum]|uniref:Membrane fusion protein (Multidrug efflux system) n=1 Tax=Novosphingobium marinum TaxID=1514948 RepID=A0A7Z0BU25_9SPHN|nr:HlyD family secretion protein [Novosphingobium marinum]NYH93860.1 membrane fusion protein (multidrug efflux system) [Novosphingobium marinum]GGC17836.1 membrane protein [Novosphingobium marinum]
MAEADPRIDESETTAATEKGTPEGSDTKQEKRRKRKKLVLMILMPLLILAGIGWYWLSLQGKVSTDNAYVKQDSVSITAEITGPIAEVFVKEGDQVKAGDPLFRIDPEPYRIALEDANAALAEAQANVTALASDADLSGTDISAAREDIAFAQSRFERQQALWERGFTTKADYDAARHSVQQARESLKAAQARQSEARARLAQGAAAPGRNPRIAAAEARKAKAELDLRRTSITAPLSGQVAQAARLQVGQMALTGLPMLEIVGQESTYVEANFKETQLDELQPGQPVRIGFDAYPGLELKGHVVSIGAGTGSEFSVLPAQNASGNWVKVTQRVPVRIAIDEDSPRKLIAGQSVEVTVRTED